MALVSVSPTKIGTWQDCQRRFYLKYIRRERVDGTWAHLSMGNSIHAALRDWFDHDDRTPRSAGELVRRSWIDEGYRDADQSMSWRENAAQMVERYCEQHPSPMPVGRERSLASLSDVVTMTGRIDRLDAQGDELVVVDYKTGRTVPTDDDARVSMALAIYAACVQKSLKRACWTVQLHHVPSGVIASHRHTPESLKRQLDRVDSIGRDMAAAEAAGDEAGFPPNPSPLCGWCDFRDLCPESSAFAAKPRWAGLAEVDSGDGSAEQD